MRLIVLILADGADGTHVAETRDSVIEALGPGTAIRCDASGLADCAHAGSLVDLPANGWDWLLLLRAGDRVSPHLGRVITQVPETARAAPAIYWDDDRWDGRRRSEPRPKPDWDPILSETYDLLAGSALIARERLARQEGIGVEDLSRLVAAGEGSGPVPFHIPLILGHHRARPSRAAEVARPQPAQWPSVSIIVPTRDRPELLAACLAGLRRLEYRGEMEWIVIDNGSSDAAALALLSEAQADPRMRVLQHPGPFNFSALNNHAAREAKGRFLCLLNNDVEPLDGEWLARMVRQALRSDAGAIGAMLVYPDRTVQHAGVAIGVGGAAGHVRRGVHASVIEHDPVFGATRSVSAVTAACLVVEHAKFHAVGGLDEEAFAVAFNDVDLCLKLGAAGWRNILAADAQLIHHESKSRGSDASPENAARFAAELARLQDRWNTRHAIDPYFSPLYSKSSDQCLLSF